VGGSQGNLQRILNTSPFPSPVTLSVARGWTANQTFIALAAFAIVVVVVVPGLVARRMRRRRP
jgi:hypothetical protein